LLTETNAARAKNSLAPLAMNQELNQAAQAKASNMLAVGYWSHNAPDGTTPWAFVENAGYKYIDAGENLARGFNTTDAIMTAWMESPSHRANVLGQDYTEVGFAAVNGRLDGRQTTLVVAMYARPIGVPSTGEATTRTNASPTESTNIWTRLRRGVQSLTPSLLITLIILGITTCVAVLAHVYRRYLPKALRNSWRRHHALYKIAFLVIVAASAVLSYGGGMI
jgi:hypothetical protein